jgi:hypothetical protein
MSDQIWVGDGNSLVLTDTTGICIHRVVDITQGYRGLHTTNSCGELIYINKYDDINKLSIHDENVITLLERKSSWRPECVFCSPTTGDLLVGLYDMATWTGQVNRYKMDGQHILTIQHKNAGHPMYTDPYHITENKNGDIIVSDKIELFRGAVVVTDSEGRHRFSYTGPPKGSALAPRGICTDALLHILVCDINTDTIQMLDRDGHFLSLLLTKHGINRPHDLDYDDKTLLLWIGSYTNKVSVYSYIQRRYSQTGT